MSYALISEVWGVPTFGVGVEEAKPEMKRVDVQTEVLEKAEASQRSHLFVTNYLREVHARHGIAGIMGLLDPPVVKELRMAALLSFEWLNSETLLFVFMCLCAIWLVIDVLRRR